MFDLQQDDCFDRVAWECAGGMSVVSSFDAILVGVTGFERSPVLMDEDACQ